MNTMALAQEYCVRLRLGLPVEEAWDRFSAL